MLLCILIVGMHLNREILVRIDELYKNWQPAIFLNIHACRMGAKVFGMRL